MARPEFLPFFFDKSERLQAIADALDRAGIRKEERVLDVGGHPGFLASALAGRRQVFTADFPPTGHPPYLRASGSALPFADRSFGAVVASDTLEHVPPAARQGFLTELWRVSSRLVLVGGPYATTGTAHAEARLRELEALVRATPDRWLAEHAEHGLPRLGDTWDLFEQQGGQVAVLPGGSMTRWFSLFAARTVLEELPGGAEALDAFMPDYNSLFAPSAMNSPPAYRHLVMASREEGPSTSWGNDALLRRADLPEEPLAPDALLHQQIDALFRIFSALAGLLRRQSERAEAGGGLDRAYMAQLEAALRQQNERLQRLEAGQRPPSLLRRLLDKATRPGKKR